MGCAQISIGLLATCRFRAAATGFANLGFDSKVPKKRCQYRCILSARRRLASKPVPGLCRPGVENVHTSKQASKQSKAKQSKAMQSKAKQSKASKQQSKQQTKQQSKAKQSKQATKQATKQAQKSKQESKLHNPPRTLVSLKQTVMLKCWPPCLQGVACVFLLCINSKQKCGVCLLLSGAGQEWPKHI